MLALSIANKADSFQTLGAGLGNTALGQTRYPSTDQNVISMKGHRRHLALFTTDSTFFMAADYSFDFFYKTGIKENTEALSVGNYLFTVAQNNQIWRWFYVGENNGGWVSTNILQTKNPDILSDNFGTVKRMAFWRLKGELPLINKEYERDTGKQVIKATGTEEYEVDLLLVMYENLNGVSKIVALTLLDSQKDWGVVSGEWKLDGGSFYDIVGDTYNIKAVAGLYGEGDKVLTEFNGNVFK